MARTSRPCDAAPARGFSYLGLLLAVAMLSAALAGVGVLWSAQARADREEELLFVGEEFRRAIAAYRERSPAGQPARYPRTLEDLLEDRRWPTVRRHLRRIYPDPMTGRAEWGLVKGPGDTIIGVHSLSDRPPAKRAGFTEEQADFAEASSYREWRFVATVTAGSPTN